jgi:hypothetical protein
MVRKMLRIFPLRNNVVVVVCELEVELTTNQTNHLPLVGLILESGKRFLKQHALEKSAGTSNNVVLYHYFHYTFSDFRVFWLLQVSAACNTSSGIGEEVYV